MDIVDNYRLKLGAKEFVPIVVGGMGVDISTDSLALEACRLGGIGHISDAMSAFVSDKNCGTHYTKAKADRYPMESRDSLDKTWVKFDLADLREAQMRYVSDVMSRKVGDGAVHINVMEKLGMGAPAETLRVRLNAALDAGIDGVTLSAGLHIRTLRLMEDNPRFRDVKIGIIVSSVRALKIFLRSSIRIDRLPDYVVVEGPLAGGHIGFGVDDWHQYELSDIVAEVIHHLKEESLDIPVIPAGGVFTGTDAVEYLQSGAAAVQVATRFTVTEECGLPDATKQTYFSSSEEDVFVSNLSATGYPIRMLHSSPCIDSNVRPQCEAMGYALTADGRCLYLDAYAATGTDEKGRKLPVKDKFCVCYNFSKYNCYTCGHYVYRLKDTSVQRPDGGYQLLTVEHVFRDYQFSRDHKIAPPARATAKPAAGPVVEN